MSDDISSRPPALVGSPIINTVLDDALEELLRAEDAESVSLWFDRFGSEIFRPDTPVNEAINAVQILTNRRHIPSTVLIQSHAGARRFMSSSTYDDFWEKVEHIYQVRFKDELPPLGDPKFWALESPNVFNLMDELRAVVDRAQHPRYILDLWRFTLTYLANYKSANLTSLVSAFRRNPQTPAEVVTEASA